MFNFYDDLVTCIQQFFKNLMVLAMLTILKYEESIFCRQICDLNRMWIAGKI